MNTRKAALLAVSSTPSEPSASKSALTLLDEYDYTVSQAINEGLIGTGKNGNITKGDVVKFLNEE